MDCNFTKKAVRIINFKPGNVHTSPLFKQNAILKFQDKLGLENILFVSRSINKLTLSVLMHGLAFPRINMILYKTSSSRKGNLIKSSYRTNRHGKYSIIASAIDSWNKI